MCAAGVGTGALGMAETNIGRKTGSVTRLAIARVRDILSWPIMEVRIHCERIKGPCVYERVENEKVGKRMVVVGSQR